MSIFPMAIADIATIFVFLLVFSVFVYDRGCRLATGGGICCGLLSLFRTRLLSSSEAVDVGLIGNFAHHAFDAFPALPDRWRR